MRPLRSTCALLLTVAALAAVPALAESGALPAGSPFIAAGAPAPRHVSQRAVITADLAKGVEITVDSRADGLLVVLPHDTAKAAVAQPQELRLVNPRGQVLRPGAAFSGVGSGRTFSEPELGSYDMPSEGAVYDLRLAPGRYTLRGDGLATVVVAQPSSPLRLATRTLPLGARAGEPVTIEARLADGEEPVAGARVVARFADEGGARELVLAEQAPGLYTATFTPVAKGLAAIDMRIDAEGVTSDGRPYRRSGTTATMVAEGVADLALERVTVDGDRLLVPLAGRPGTYRVEAIFGATAGADVAGLAWSHEDVVLGADGERVVALAIPAAAAGAERLTLKLLNHDTLGLERDADLALVVPGKVAVVSPAREPLPASKRLGRRLSEEP